MSNEKVSGEDATAPVDGFSVRGRLSEDRSMSRDFTMRISLLYAAEACGAFYPLPMVEGDAGWKSSIKKVVGGATFRFLFATRDQADRFWPMVKDLWEQGGRAVKREPFSFAPGVHEAVGASHCLRWEAEKTDLSLTYMFGSMDALKIAFAKALEANTTLTGLTLSICRIDSVSAGVIAEALKVNTTLRTIDFTHNMMIGNMGCTALAEALKVNRSLTDVCLGTAGITDGGAASIAEMLRTNNTLTRLELSGNVIGPVGAGSIAEALKVNKSLRRIDVSVGGIGNVGAASIAEALKVNTTLRHLNMMSNDISDAGAASIAEALRANETLTFVGLSMNRIGDDGAGSIAEALRVNKTLSCLNLSRNRLGDAGRDVIAAAVEENSIPLVPLTPLQRMAFLQGHIWRGKFNRDAAASSKPQRTQLPMDLVRRILLKYDVAQGERVFDAQRFLLTTELPVALK